MSPVGRFISIALLGEYLKSHREHREETFVHVVRRWKALALPRPIRLGDHTLTPRSDRLSALEDGKLSGRCSLEEAAPLSEAYGIPHLLLSTTSWNDLDGGNRLTFDLGKFRSCEPEQGSPAGESERTAKWYGPGSHYSIPELRLSGSDAVFVKLTLDAQAPKDPSDDGSGHSHSIAHRHAGEELLVVLDGEVSYHLEDQGLTHVLGRHGYIHLNAAQRHSAWNNSLTEQATAFIIRFDQIQSVGTRRAILNSVEAIRKDLRTADACLSPKSKDDFRKMVDPWISETIATSYPNVEIQADACAGEHLVRDIIGLGRRLQQFNSKDQLGYQELAVKANDLGYHERTETDIANMFCGRKLSRSTRPADYKDLQMFARIFEIEPVLLYHLIAPSASSAVALRSHVSGPYGEYIRVRGEEWEICEGATYYIPSRHLAGSDMVIDLLELEVGSSSPKNSHPGFELIYVLQGDAEVQFDTPPFCTAGRNRHQFAHYQSNQPHRVVNTGQGPAVLMVMRFFEDPSLYG